MNAAENYPAWLAAIGEAQRSIYFETYLLHGDAAGQRFASAFVDAARRGVHVCVLYDWLGGVWTSRLFWRQLTEHGVDVRCFNRPRVANVFGLSSRDHRKLLVIDDEVGFVIATNPAEADLYRLDTLVASAAREFLWLTDAYFVANNSYVQALAAAARDGVDVRLLLPGTSDVTVCARALGDRISATARRRRAHLRVERDDVAREDR